MLRVTSFFITTCCSGSVWSGSNSPGATVTSARICDQSPQPVQSSGPYSVSEFADRWIGGGSLESVKLACALCLVPCDGDERKMRE